MAYIRINKLLRYTDLSIEELSGLLGKEEVLSPNTKLGVYVEENGSVDYNSLSTQELLSIRNNVYTILNRRLITMRDEYVSLQKSIETIDITR